MPQIERLLPVNNERAARRIITVTGVSGCGKDYFVELSKKIAPDVIGNQVSVFNFGAELLRTISSQNPGLNISSKDLLKYLPQVEIERHIKTTLETLINKQPALYLTHVVLQQQQELVISPDVERWVNAWEYVFIYTDPCQVPNFL